MCKHGFLKGDYFGFMALLVSLSKKTTEIYFEIVIGSMEKNSVYCKLKAYMLMITEDILKMNINHLRACDPIFTKISCCSYRTCFDTGPIHTSLSSYIFFITKNELESIILMILRTSERKQLLQAGSVIYSPSFSLRMM